MRVGMAFARTFAGSFVMGLPLAYDNENYALRDTFIQRMSMRTLLKWLAVLITAGLTSGCESLPFYPVRELVATPTDVGLHYEEVRFATEDGERIAGWFIPAPQGQSPDRAKTLLFFHGNAGNISHRLPSIEIFRQLGLNVFIIDYRGFGHSTGSPSVQGTLLDARAAWHWLRQEKGCHADDVVIFGRSLGGGVAADLAAEVQPAALILESTFTSLYAVGKALFPYLPMRLFFPQDYDVLARLEKLRSPLLVVHSRKDEVIPFRLGESLFQSYTGPKAFLEIRGRHNSGYLEDREVYESGLRNFLNRLRTDWDEKKALPDRGILPLENRQQ
jgi:fermentation-respiration switch protein FrsA (DUF1100 family)